MAKRHEPRRRAATRPARAPRNVALFLGAGASAHFGYPVTSAILPLILERIESRQLFEPMRGKTKPQVTKSQAQSLCNQLKRLLKQVLPGLDHPEAAAPSITDVLSFVDEHLRSGLLPLPNITANDLRQLRQLLERAICDVLTPSDRPEHEGLQRLIRWMRKRVDAGGRCTIVSTNYDLLYEKALYRELEGQARTDVVRESVDFGVAFRDYGRQGRVIQRPFNPRWAVYKLHGSFNWARCEVCDHIYIRPKRNLWRIVDYAPSDFNACYCGHGPLQRLIVAPSFVRDIRDSNLLSVWRSALEAMRTAEDWYIIGYSLPQEDLAIRSLLRRAYYSRGATGRPEESRAIRQTPPLPPPRVHVIQRSVDAKGRYLLDFPDCDYQCCGVGPWIEALTG